MLVFENYIVELRDDTTPDATEIWCMENLGYYRPRYNHEYALILYFRTQEDATVCKLALGGVYVYDEVK